MNAAPDGKPAQRPSLQCSMSSPPSAPAAPRPGADTVCPAMAQTAPPLAPPGRLARWRHALRTVNPPSGELDQVSRWLVITRAGVLPMTITAGAIAGLLAVGRRDFAAGWFALSFIGIVLAHVSNNLVNDLFDTDTGLDTEQYPR